MHEPIPAKILRYFVYACCFVPLVIFNDYISPFHFGKVVIFRSLVEVMLVFYILLVWKDRSYWPKFNSVSWAFFAFASAFSVASFASIIPYMSAWGSLERMGGVITFWHYFAFFVILISVFRTERDWLNLFSLMMGVGILSAIYGFGQRTDIEFFVGSGGRERIFGTIGNAALFAGYQILILFLALTMYFRDSNSKNYKIFYAITFLTCTIAALMTAVRGSVLAIGVGFLVFALLYGSAYHSKKAKKAFLSLIVILVLFVGFGLMFEKSSFVQNSRYLRRVTNFSFQSYTVQTRFWAWQAGIKGWSENPKTILVGWGPENFNIPFSKYFNPKFFQGPGSETLFDRAHNMFVEILVTMGLIGLLSYLSIFAASIRVLYKKLVPRGKEALYGVGFITLLIAYAIHNSFIFDTSANFLTFFTILGFIYFLNLSKEQEVKPKPKKINSGLFAVVGAGLFITAIVAVYNINILPAKANYTTTRAIIIGWNSDFAGAIKKYEEAMQYNVPGKYEIRHRFAQFVLEQTNSGKLNQARVDALHEAIDQVVKNINENHEDYLPYLYIARLYIILGRDEPQSEYNQKSLEYSMKALDIAPTFVRTYYEIGQAYLNMKDLDNASKYFKKAAELNPEVGLSSWYWAVVEVERGNVNFGIDIIEKIIASGTYVPTESDLGRLIGLYVSRNDLSKTIWVSGLLVGLKPENAQYHASLAVAYARAGKRDEAIAQAREAARLDPKFESEASSFIQSLGGSL